MQNEEVDSVTFCVYLNRPAPLVQNEAMEAAAAAAAANYYYQNIMSCTHKMKPGRDT